MLDDAALAAALAGGALSAHYPQTNSTADALATGLPLWAGEVRAMMCHRRISSLNDYRVTADRPPALWAGEV